MWIILEIFILSVVTQVVVSEEFTVYTHKSIRDDNGKPCLTGCSSETNQCIINWKREKRSCKSLDELAPIYQTSQYKDTRKYCLSNCGPYDDNYDYEWCFTAEDFSKWDYCSSNERRDFLATNQIQGMTTSKKTCTDQCSKGRDTYYWCHYNKDGTQTWDTCALPALPRIPVLHNNFAIGEKNKGKCDDFLKYDSVYYRPSSFSTSSEVPDNYIRGLAEAIESVGSNKLTQIVTLNEVNNPVKSYAMVKIRDLMVPAVIRAHINKDSLKLGTNVTKASSTIEMKIQQQMLGTTHGFETGTLISFDLGGPNAEYNFVPRSIDWKCDDWVDMEEAVRDWYRRTGGSVEMIIVVFYKDAKTPIPKAFGVSQIFKNSDHSVFVDCREKIYWNNF